MEQKNSNAEIPRVISPYVEENDSKAGRFITLSMFIHAALVATVALMSFPPPEIMKSDVIEIEMGDSSPSMPNGLDLSGSGASGGAAEAKVSPATPAPPPPPAPAAPAPPVAKVAPAPAPAPKAAAAAPEAVKPTKVEAAATEADTFAPDLDTSENGEVAVAPPQASDQQEQEDIAAKAEKARAEEEAAQKAAEAKAAAIAAEQKQRLEAAREAKARERAEAEARAKEKAHAEALVAQQAEAEAKALAEAKAAEDAKAAEEANRARAAKAAAEAAAAAEAESIAAADSGTSGTTGSGGPGEKTAPEGDGEGHTSGSGSGSATSPEPTKQVAGIPGGVRTLGQLRQRPGNRNPQYDRQERLARQEGDVVFYAYVNRDGSLSEFKKAQGTGFTNLDDKTLEALRKWKFYPGQEGWVEMPFKWSLRGEAQEAGGQLRNHR